MDLFEQTANQMVLYHLRTSWLNIAKAFNDKAHLYNGTISMAFVLMAMYEEEGVPVTKIAPRIGITEQFIAHPKQLRRKWGYIAKTGGK